MVDKGSKTEGLRARKHQATLQRIAEVGLELFLANGYETTTLDDIAAAADISRRTVFRYFARKEDILLAGYPETMKALIIKNATGGTPFDVARAAVLELVAPHREAQLLATARLVHQSETLRARDHGKLRQLEQAAVESLCVLWPEKKNRDRCRLAAMMAIGALRLASDNWIEQDGKHSLAKCVRDLFNKMTADL